MNRISVFDKEGTSLSSWDTAGNNYGELNGPSGIAFDSDDNVFVVDSANNRIQKFTKEGSFLGSFGQEGQDEGELNLPWGICLDNACNVYVADWCNNRVQKFDREGHFQGTDTGVGDLHGPMGVAVDSEGDVYVTLGQTPGADPRLRRPFHHNSGG